MELTAEEWRKRYEKERDKNARLKLLLERYEAELGRWRTGDSVPQTEQMELKAVASLASSSSTTNLTTLLAKVPVATAGGAPTSEERTIWELEKQSLYQQLDDKDEEINNQCQLVEQLKEQQLEGEELLSAQRREQDSLQNDMTRKEVEIEAAKDEVKEVLQALEELAMNYDQKSQEVDSKTKENDSLTDDLQKKLSVLNSVEGEVHQLKDNLLHQKKRASDNMISLLKDLNEIGAMFGHDLDLKITLSEKSDDEFTRTRLFISKMRSEVKTLLTRCTQLDAFQVDATKKLASCEQSLSDSQLLIQQHEAKMKTIAETMKSTENKKRALEDQVDSLNEELASVKAKEQLYVSKLSDSEKEKTVTQDTVDQIKVGMESQMEQVREAHHKQLHSLRSEISDKEAQILDLTGLNQKLSLSQEKLQSDYERLKRDETQQSAKLADVNMQLDRRVQAQQDLKGLEETVAKELQTLHNLRKLFVQDLQARVKKSQSKTDDDDNEENMSSVAQRQKINFLENNLDQLTKVHKQLVRDNADLRCELPKLEKRLRATVERVKALEQALKEAKEGALRDRKRYQHEVDRIKEAVRQRNLMRRGHSAQIAKPIRAGHAPLPGLAIRAGGAQAANGPSTIRGGGAAH